MFKHYWLVVIAIISLVLIDCSYAKIIQIRSFGEIDINEILEQKCKSPLVLVDVDHTLVRPSDRILAQDNRLYHLAKDNNLLDSDWRTLSDIIKQEAICPLIEPCSVKVLEYLQQRDISVIACTAMRTGTSLNGFCREKWRYDHLKSLGFKGSFHDKKFSLDVSAFEKGKNPLFYHGVLCADVVPKGIVVYFFLLAMVLYPQLIVMIDDSLDQLSSVQEMCNSLCQHGQQIEFIGYHYDNPPSEEGDELLGLFQAGYLMKYKKWLSDAEAKKRMNMQACAMGYSDK